MKQSIFLLVFTLLCSTLSNAQNDAMGVLPRTSHKNESVSNTDLEAFYKAIEESKMDFHSVMIVKNGKVISEKWWGDNAPDKNHVMYSVSKSFTATAIGFAIHEGHIKLDDKVMSFFPDKIPADASPFLKKMKIWDLLTMSTGQEKEPRTTSDDWIKDFFEVPVTKEPGTYFLYNSLATFMLSAIIQEVTGEKLIDYLYPRLFQPLGIHDIQWDSNPQGINIGGWGLYLKTEDMAKFGLLFLQKGVWNGKQLLPKGWVEEALSWKVKSTPAGQPEMTDPNSDWTQGYCFQMWRSRHGYRADGANGQYIIILPEEDAVIAVTANIPDMQKEINLIWEHVLPLLQ